MRTTCVLLLMVLGFGWSPGPEAEAADTPVTLVGTVSVQRQGDAIVAIHLHTSQGAIAVRMDQNARLVAPHHGRKVQVAGKMGGGTVSVTSVRVIP